MNYELKNYEDAVDKAKSKGKKIIIPKDDELQIDIDTTRQYGIFKLNIKELNEFFHSVWKIREYQSPRGPDHRHIYIRLDDNIKDTERAFLQLFLGSDPVREYLSMCLIKIGDPHPILMFEEPGFELDWRK